MRSIKQILIDFPQTLRKFPVGCKREAAFIESLETASEHDYQLLKILFKTGMIALFIPEKRIAGCLLNSKNLQCTLYLSPQLEDMKYQSVSRVIRHELYHVLHDSDFKSEKPLSLVEAQARLGALTWGEH